MFIQFYILGLQIAPPAIENSLKLTFKDISHE